MKRTPPNQTLIFNPEFLERLGGFHAAWSALEQTVDFGIAKLLNITYEQMHVLTAGTMFGTKARFLIALIKRSNHPNKEALLKALNHVRGEVKRDWLAHSYMSASRDRVFFLHRSAANEYSVNQIDFSLDEFKAHVRAMTSHGADLQEALGMTEEDLDALVAAAESATNK